MLQAKLEQGTPSYLFGVITAKNLFAFARNITVYSTELNLTPLRQLIHLNISGRIDLFPVLYDLAHASRGEGGGGVTRRICIIYILCTRTRHVFSCDESVLYTYVDPAQPLITAGEELEYLL